LLALTPLLLVLFESSEVLPCWSLEESSDCGQLAFGEFLSFIESQRLILLRLEVALEGMNRSEVPKSAGTRPKVERLVGVLPELPRLLWELESLDSGKCHFLGEAL
jgi:hypothetical protein